MSSQGRSLTHKAVCSLHVQLHVALLCEAHDTVVTPVGSLARVLLHVHLQRALLVEGFVTQSAVEWPLPCMQSVSTVSVFLHTLQQSTMSLIPDSSVLRKTTTVAVSSMLVKPCHAEMKMKPDSRGTQTHRNVQKYNTHYLNKIF